MPFTHDIFISYGHLDDQNPFGHEKGWVDLLYERLKMLVGQKLGEEPKIWRDEHNLRGQDKLEGAISEGVTQSLLFVPVITPRYVQSDWCHREIEAFHAVDPPPKKTSPGFRTRVFKVLKTPLPDHLKTLEPAQIRNLTGYQFYAEDELSGVLTEFIPDRTDKRYYQMLDRLVAHITDTLIDLKHFSETKQAGSLEVPLVNAPSPSRAITNATTTASSRSSASQPNGTGGSPPQRSIYVAETTKDLADERQFVCDELQQRGYGVLPEQKLPGEEVKQTEDAVRAALARSALSVHLVGTRYGSTPEDDARSVVRIQEQLAAAHGAANPDFLRLLWMPENLKAMEISDERQKTYVSELQTRITAGAELLQTSIDDLKTRIVEKLNPPAKTITRAHRHSKLKKVYLICEERDHELVKPIEDFLFNEKIEVITWLDQSSNDTLMDYHRKNLRECDAALVYFGSCDLPWVDKNLDDLEKAYGYGRELDWVANALYVGSPANQQKERFRSIRADYFVRNFKSFDPNELRDFVTKVKASEGGV